MASVMPTPSDVCSLAQHRPLLSHANHVGSRLRQVTCATRVVGRSLLRALTKLSVTVATSSHRIIRGLISPDWPRFSKSLVLSRLMPLSTNFLVPIVSIALLISGLSLAVMLSERCHVDFECIHLHTSHVDFYEVCQCDTSWRMFPT